MSPPDGNFGSATPELRELVKAVCDGKLTRRQRDRLEILLRADESARLFYLAHLEIQARLQWEFRGGTGEDAADSGDSDQRSRGRGAIFPRILGGALDSTAKWLRPPTHRLFAAALLLCAVGLATAAGAHFLRPRAQSVERQYIAQLGLVLDAQWADPALMLIEPRFRPGRELVLKKGLAQITFASGVSLLLEGPATLRFESENEVFLANGRASAEVPADAIGFTVHTPKAKVVDLGTAFGVRVDSRGATEIQVFKGKVNAATRDVVTQNARSYELTEGEALRIGEGNRTEVDLGANPASFPRLPAPTQTERFERWRVYRDQLCRDTSLVGYWSFDDGTATDLSGNRNDGAPVGILDFSPDVPAAIGGGKCLDVSGGPSYVLIPHSASLTVSDELTVAFWMRGSNRQQDWARIISKAGPTNCSGWVVHRAADMNQIRAVVGNSTQCNQSIADMKGVYDGQWHHVVITANRGEWCAYLDGALDSRGKYSHHEGLGSTADLVIGAAGMDQTFGEYDFEGQIDEVAIFRRAISHEEVQRMVEAGN